MLTTQEWAAKITGQVVTDYVAAADKYAFCLAFVEGDEMMDGTTMCKAATDSAAAVFERLEIERNG